MQARTERFELRLDEDFLGRIDAWRDNKSMSRSEAVRTLIELGLDRGPPSLNDGDRLILMLLRDMFKHLNIKGEVEPDFIAEAIWGGHFWALDWQYPGLFHGHRDTQSMVSNVVDILDCWFFIESAFTKLSKAEQEYVEAEADEQAHFLGFDGNNETSYMAIAQFLIDKMGRFSWFKGRSMNSHSYTLGRYLAMAQVFEPIRKTLVGREMSVEELIKVLKSQRN